MYLKTLTLFGFGQFHDRTFNLERGLNVLVGPNEAGKSTLTQFITAILFGFPTKKHPELRYEPLDGSRFGGAITFVQDATQYQVTRVDGPRGGTVTLRNLTLDLELPASQLAKLLAPVDAQLFQNVYALNEMRLGQVFQASKQDLTTHLQHVGAVGSDDWLVQAKRLDQRAEEAYKPQGRKPLLNDLLRQHQDLQAKLDKANTAYQTYWQLLQDQATAKHRQAALREQLATHRQTVTHWTQLQQQWPTFQRWQALGTAQQQPTTGFTQADATELERLQNQLTASQATAKTNQSRLKDLQAHAQLPALFQQYLKVSEQVDPLFDQVPAVTAQAQERTRLMATVQELTQRSTAIEQQVANANGQMPRPFSLATTQELKQQQADLQLANQKRRRLQQELNRLNDQYQQAQPTRQQRNPLADKQLGWLAAGLLVLVGAMFLPGTLFKLVGAALGIAVGYYGVFIVDGETPASRELQGLTADIRDVQAQLREGGQRIDALTNRIDAIGEAHGLDHLPHEQWFGAQAAIGEWERLTQQLQATHTQLTALQATLDQFQQAVTAVLPQLAGQSVTSQTTQLRQLQTTQQRLVAQNGELAGLTDRIQQDHTAVARAQQAVRTFLQTRNVADTAAFYQRYQQIQNQDNVTAQRQALATQLGTTLADLQALPDQATLDQHVTTAQQAQQTTQQQLDATTTQLATLSGQLEHLTASGTQTALRQRLANLETQMRTVTQGWLTDRLTSRWISATLVAASGDRLPRIVDQASEYYAQLTENRYTKLELTSETLRVQRADGTWLPVGQLSRGTAEQLDLAMKLAFAVVMQAQAAMPLVIDDGLVNFDARRRQAAYALLLTLSQHLQIILLTADPVAAQAAAGKYVVRLTTQEGD
ncbi:ATP-binding protein [Levilactobacillus spicheri]|uniref:Membrane protein n=2 Tax=Levilactobacillus spicheri TaxID=216463 RepID=A0ABQ0WND0_9LACO|nr:AAA family ATPase [Levilactobacillus spicheri]KRL50377.1 DNA repair ATPase [Levilactobacillus spicheri DSM 15429]GEO66110.1 membrane protein [Levilactobacillus spicheri]